MIVRTETYFAQFSMYNLYKQFLTARVQDHQQKRNFPFFHKGFQNFWVKLLRTLQKNQPTIFLCSLDTFFHYELTIQTTIILK